MRQVELHHGAATDVGLVREVNEDAYLASPPVFVVADGMGGHDGGDVASAIVVEEFGRLADDGYDPRRGADAVASTLERCQRRIAEYGESQVTSGRHQWYAGTTVVVALLVEDDGGPQWLLANLGDSRIYRFADDELEQVSVDHSVVQELMDAGEITSDDAATHPERHVITRALGGPDRRRGRLLPAAAAVGGAAGALLRRRQRGMIDDAEIDAILRETDDPRDAADRMVAAAVAAGGQDNATAVVVDVVGLAAADDYDSARQMESLEQKLGALP